MKSYTTKLRPTTEYTYTLMLPGMAGDFVDILNKEHISCNVISTCDLPDEETDVFEFHGHTIRNGIVAIKAKVNAIDMRTLLEELY